MFWRASKPPLKQLMTKIKYHYITYSENHCLSSWREQVWRKKRAAVIWGDVGVGEAIDGELAPGHGVWIERGVLEQSHFFCSYHAFILFFSLQIHFVQILLCFFADSFPENKWAQKKTLWQCCGVFCQAENVRQILNGVHRKLISKAWWFIFCTNSFDLSNPTHKTLWEPRVQVQGSSELLHDARNGQVLFWLVRASPAINLTLNRSVWMLNMSWFNLIYKNKHGASVTF